MGQRTPKTPPHVGLRDLRTAFGFTQEQVIARAKEADPRVTLSKGSLSAVESGDRGASDRLLRALEQAYNMRPGALRTDYKPRMGSGDAA